MSIYPPPRDIVPIYNPLNYLDSDSGLSVVDADARYLRLVGGSLSGSLTVASSLTTSGVNFLSNGSVGAPSLSFTTDSDTGFYRSAANTMNFSTNGVSRLQIDTTEIDVTLPLCAPLGSVGAPVYSFTGDVNTGIYSSGANSIDFTANGANKMRTFTKEQLSEILAKHKAWLNNEEGGERANLRNANLSCADLSDANLSNANLSYADLSDANLRNANLRFLHSANGKELACMNAGKYQVVLSKEKIAIGCKFFTVEEWKEFDDDKISKMDDGSLEWWKQWKEVILMFHANVFC